MNRRQLLQAAAAIAPMAIGARVYAATEVKSRLLIVFLRGAYDAANVVIPVSSDFYYRSRPTLAIARPNESDPNAALALDSNWGLHPAFKDTLYPLYRNGQLAFIPFAGTDDTSRSHFETQDTIELGQAHDHSRDYHSGFMGRLAAQVGAFNPIAFTDQLPLTFQGTPNPIPNMSLNAVGKPAVDARQADLIMSMYQGSALAPRVSQGFAVRDEVYKTVTSEMQDANRNAVTAKGFEVAARRIGALMDDKFNLGFVDVGGWDTHVNQGGATGYLAGRLTELGKGLAGFVEATGPKWKDTVVVVLSEFGRTFRENGDRGTDHGHGSVYWVLGGSVKGGRIAGEQVKVEETSLFQKRDYPVFNDYRGILSGLFSRMYGLSQEQMQKVFPDVTAKDFHLV